MRAGRARSFAMPQIIFMHLGAPWMHEGLCWAFALNYNLHHHCLNRRFCTQVCRIQTPL
jgi:hypothetical protein